MDGNPILSALQHLKALLSYFVWFSSYLKKDIRLDNYCSVMTETGNPDKQFESE
jgi:hypothetical protein